MGLAAAWNPLPIQVDNAEVRVLIEAAGKTWIVEQQDLTSSLRGGGGRFSGLTFRDPESSDEVYVRWVLRPERLTRRLAEELFEIAGVRAWRDPRDGRVYELRIDAASLPAGPDGPAPLQVIRFLSSAGEAEAPWTLARPLGWASDAELMQLLDRARQDRSPHEVPEG